MIESKMGTIKLSGEDAVRFADSLFRPTQAEIKRSVECLDRISKGVSIQRTQNGFKADIDGLDLSFLDDIQNERKINIKITFAFWDQTNGYYSFDNSNMNKIIVQKKDVHYNLESNKSIISWAA